jgi:transcriptional regulator with XRE-family HTH domain
MGLTVQVAEEIRAMMARRRMTGAGLARTLGVSEAWVSYRLSGKQAIDLNDLERIADVLGVAPQDLLPPQIGAAGRRELWRSHQGRSDTGQYPPVIIRPAGGPAGTRPSDKRPPHRPGDIRLVAA